MYNYYTWLVTFEIMDKDLEFIRDESLNIVTLEELDQLSREELKDYILYNNLVEIYPEEGESIYVNGLEIECANYEKVSRSDLSYWMYDD